MGTIIYCENYESTRKELKSKMIDVFGVDVIDGSDINEISDAVESMLSKSPHEIKLAITDEGIYDTERRYKYGCECKDFVAVLRANGYGGPIVYIGEKQLNLECRCMKDEVNEFIYKDDFLSADSKCTYDEAVMAIVEKYLPRTDVAEK